jgi:hypothetical protein
MRAIRSSGDRVVERPPDAHVVEGLGVRVERDEVEDLRRVGVHLRGAREPDRGQLRRRQQAVDPVAAAGLDRRRRGVEGADVPPGDRVGVAGRLGGVRPLAEARVAHEPQPARREARHAVRARAGDRRASGVLVGDARRDRRRVREDGQLEEEVGVGLAQAEGDRARAILGRDAVGKAAVLRARPAAAGADDAREVVGAERADAEQALDGAPEVGGAHEPPVGVADPGP